MSNETIVERVSRAIAGVPKPDDYESQARAALAALRDPTPAMIQRGRAAHGVEENLLIDSWYGMIDEATRGNA